MTAEEELRVRSQAEAQTLAQFFQMAMNQLVVVSGENAVLKAKAEQKKEEA